MKKRPDPEGEKKTFCIKQMTNYSVHMVKFALVPQNFHYFSPTIQNKITFSRHNDFITMPYNTLPRRLLTVALQTCSHITAIGNSGACLIMKIMPTMDFKMCSVFVQNIIYFSSDFNRIMSWTCS